ncbi:MAG: hypothetical protein K0R20_2515 [Actinomycetia bacterium]|jgi:hypothetical protein|nr:hypothetical protein [Actinomycetes bacterium]
MKVPVVVNKHRVPAEMDGYDESTPPYVQPRAPGPQLHRAAKS